MNEGDEMFGMRENGELDPFRYDGHLDAPQEVARMLADLGPPLRSRKQSANVASETREV